MITRSIRLPLSLLGTFLLVSGFLFGQAAPVRAFSSILYVAPGASCIGMPNCFATVQAALDVAEPGVEIRVAAGTYTGVTTVGSRTQVVFINKTATIRGGYNASFSIRDPAVNVTTLDAQNLGRVIYILPGNISPTIDGLSLTGGNASGQGGYEYYGSYDAGGGVYDFSSSVTLINNRIFENTSPGYGGGVYLGYSASLLSGNTINDNHVTSGGGGGGLFLYQSDATLSGNRITSNTSNNLGGGLYLFSSNANLTGNMITGNTTTLYGGGVDVASCSPTLNGNIISGNVASSTLIGRAGGIYLWDSNSVLTNNVIMDNQSNFSGSGLYIGGSTPLLLNNTIARNTGGDGSGVFITFDSSAKNSIVTMTNTILINQAVGVAVNSGSVATLDGVLWFGNAADTGGAGTINVSNSFIGDPVFAPDGYHLTAGSAAIDKGVNAGVMTDIDGQPRSSLPDLGADEYWAPGALKYIFLPSINR